MKLPIALTKNEPAFKETKNSMTEVPYADQGDVVVVDS